MMMKRQDSQETPSPLPPLTYQSPDAVTPHNYVTSTTMTPELVYQNRVASKTMLPNPPMQNQSENDTLDHELRSKLSELVHQISKEDLTSSDDEPIHKVIDRRCVGEWAKESDRVIHRERKNESQKESNGKIEMERNKRKMERLSERWIERQIVRECEEFDVVRQRHRERDQKREGSTEIQRERKNQDWERQKEEKQSQLERSWQKRQVETEIENEIEPLCERDVQDSETQQVTITEKAKDGGLDAKERVEEGHYLNEEKVNRGLLQRKKSEKDSEKRTEACSCSAPSNPEEQISPTEVRRENKESESVFQFQFHLSLFHSPSDTLFSIFPQLVKVK